MAADPLKFTVRVVIEKEVEVELPAHFASDDYLETWRKELWAIEGVADIAKYAASMAAQYGGGSEHDGLGLLSESYSTFPRVPDVKFDIGYDDTETEIIKGAQ